MSDEAFAIAVEGTVDATGELEPTRLRLDSRTVEVVEILDRWPGPDHRYVKLRGADGATYILRHDRVRDRWRLVLFERNLPADAPRLARDATPRT